MSSDYTCTKCGEQVVFNVPRLGINGGFVHKSTGRFLCGECRDLGIPTKAVTDCQTAEPISGAELAKP